jgi:type 2 lantibiotic biosynthesis protein LanM
VALFLAYLGQCTGGERVTTLARAVVRRLRCQLADGLAPLPTIGAFSGQGGLLYTFAHLATLWRDSELLHATEPVVADLRGLIAADEQLDVAGGSAGCIGALLALHAVAPSARLVHTAVTAGEHLLKNARFMAHGIGWATPAPGGAALTGFAHGAAGIAWALDRLSAVSGDKRFASAARAALGYERSLYSADNQNWPDLRWAGDAPRFMRAWCHGAPGIGLGRLSMLDRAVDSTMCGEIQASLMTTSRQRITSNHALCHGELGNLDLLVTAPDRLADPNWLGEARRRAADAVSFAEQSGGWVCTTPFGLQSPGLMTGLAGIGYGLLRIAMPERVPSLLSLEPPNR